MTTDFRALCVELLAWADKTSAHYYAPPEVLVRARAALAEPEPEGPTDEELNALWNCCGIANEHGHHEGNIFDYARAVLTRWGRSDGPAVPDGREPASVAFEASDAGPADGEVAELATAEMVRQLRTKAATEKSSRYHYSSTLLTRAADLLERLSPPQPVPVEVEA